MQNYKEIWKDIPNYEGMYQVSNLGRVKSLKRGKQHFLKCWEHCSGYIHVGLSINFKRKTFKVHRLVMLAFVGESDLQVNHKNGIKADNRLENLEYCTRSENIIHAFKIGLAKGLKGEKNGNSRLTEHEVKKIKYGHQGMSIRAIAKIYGVSKSLVHVIRSRENWKHI